MSPVFQPNIYRPARLKNKQRQMPLHSFDRDQESLFDSSAAWPTRAPVPAESMRIFGNIARKYRSPKGERQMFPVQITRIELNIIMAKF